jgi:hypothetical protein
MDDLRDYVSDNMGKLIFVGGAVFLAVGVISSSVVGSILSAVTLLLGILFVFGGMFFQLGLFSGGLFSWSGFAMVLVLVAIVGFAFGFVALEFLDVVYGIQPVIFRATVMGYELIVVKTDRPYVWLSDLCFKFGFGFLIVGVVLRIASALKH